MERKTVYLYLSIITSIIFLIISGFFIITLIDDFPQLWNSYNTFSGALSYLSLKLLLPAVILISISFYFGRVALKLVRNNIYLRKKKFKFILPVMVIIVSLLGMVGFFIYEVIAYQINPSDEAFIASAFVAAFISVIGFILMILFGVIGFLVDRKNKKFLESKYSGN